MYDRRTSRGALRVPEQKTKRPKTVNAPLPTDEQLAKDGSHRGKHRQVDVTEIACRADQADGRWVRVTGYTTNQARAARRELLRRGYEVSMAGIGTQRVVLYVALSDDPDAQEAKSWT